MALEALASNGGARQGEGFLEPPSHARDGGTGDLVVEGGGGRAEPPDGLHAAHGGEMVGGGRAQARAGVPVARADVLGEAADAPRAEAQGRGSAAVDVFPVQEGGLQRLFGEHVGRGARALRQEAYCTDGGFLGTLARATEGESRHHVLPPWGHAIAPFVR